MSGVQLSLGKLLADACCAAVAAFVFGLCLGHTLIQPRDFLYLSGIAVAAALLLFALSRARRAGRRFTGHSSSDSARKTASQFLWSCVFFAIISAMFGLAVAGFVWSSPSFLRTFSLYFYGALTFAAIYPVRRDAKRLTEAAAGLS